MCLTPAAELGVDISTVTGCLFLLDDVGAKGHAEVNRLTGEVGRVVVVVA